jgi:hypothetical protein
MRLHLVVIAALALLALHREAEARPQLTVVSPATGRLAFGRLPFDVASAPQRITIRNDGDPGRVVDLSAFGLVSIVATGGGLGTGESQFWDVVCTPQAAVAELAYVDIEICGASCEDDRRFSFDVDCTGGLLDSLSTPAFMVAYQYETHPEILGFSNPGPDPVTITSLATRDPVFSAVPATGTLPVTLAAGERFDVLARFTGSGGDVTSVLDVLAGTSIVARGDLIGLQRGQIDPISVTLGAVPLGAVYTMPVSVRNSFPSARTITAVSSSVADCAVTGLVGTTLAPGTFGYGLLTRTASTLGARTCVLTVAFDQGQGDSGRVFADVVPATFSITTEDATPGDGRIDFGTREVGSAPVDRKVTIANLSSVERDLFDCSIGGGPFTLVSACPDVLPANGSVELIVRLTPGEAGELSGAISIGTLGLGHVTSWLSATVVSPAPPPEGPPPEGPPPEGPPPGGPPPGEPPPGGPPPGPPLPDDPPGAGGCSAGGAAGGLPVAALLVGLARLARRRRRRA